MQPFTPYIASELAAHLGETEPAALLAWPEAGPRDEASEAEMARLQAVIAAVRRIRNENRVQEKAAVRAFIRTEAPDLLLANEPMLAKLARLESLEAGPAVARPASSATEVLAGDEVYVSLEGLVDFAAERARKQKEIEKAKGFLAGIEKKLANENFTSRAKPEVVQRERDRAEEVRGKIALLEQALADLA
jgi:valyl-tRNA synthetase